MVNTCKGAGHKHLRSSFKVVCAVDRIYHVVITHSERLFGPHITDGVASLEEIHKNAKHGHFSLTFQTYQAKCDFKFKKIPILLELNSN